MTRGTVRVVVGSDAMVSLVCNVHKSGTLIVANEP